MSTIVLIILVIVVLAAVAILFLGNYIQGAGGFEAGTEKATTGMEEFVGTDAP